jgi:hypothetical protein
MHLKDWPLQFLKLLTSDAAALALMVVKVKTFLTFSPPRRTGVVGAVVHGWHLGVSDSQTIP